MATGGTNVATAPSPVGRRARDPGSQSCLSPTRGQGGCPAWLSPRPVVSRFPLQSPVMD